MAAQIMPEATSVRTALVYHAVFTADGSRVTAAAADGCKSDESLLYHFLEVRQKCRVCPAYPALECFHQFGQKHGAVTPERFHNEPLLFGQSFFHPNPHKDLLSTIEFVLS